MKIDEYRGFWCGDGLKQTSIGAVARHAQYGILSSHQLRDAVLKGPMPIQPIIHEDPGNSFAMSLVLQNFDFRFGNPTIPGPCSSATATLAYPAERECLQRTVTDLLK
jgi:hypothetical protein